MFAQSSEKISASIADERQTIAGIEAGVTAIRHQREEALVEGDNKAVDAADAKLAQIRLDIDRRNERVALLEAKATEARERETSKALDVIAARANAARDAGEKLIRTEYARLAAALRSTMGNLSAIEQVIAEANATLTRAGRTPVASPNQIRCLPSAVIERTERRRVGIGEPDHPYYGRASVSQGNAHAPTDTLRATVHGSGETVDAWTEVDVAIKERRAAFVPEPLTTAVVLPSIEPDGSAPAYWDRHSARRDGAAAVAGLGL